MYIRVFSFNYFLSNNRRHKIDAGIAGFRNTTTGRRFVVRPSVRIWRPSDHGTWPLHYHYCYAMPLSEWIALTWTRDCRSSNWAREKNRILGIPWPDISRLMKSRVKWKGAGKRVFERIIYYCYNFVLYHFLFA